MSSELASTELSKKPLKIFHSVPPKDLLRVYAETVFYGILIHSHQIRVQLYMLLYFLLDNVVTRAFWPRGQDSAALLDIVGSSADFGLTRIFFMHRTISTSSCRRNYAMMRMISLVMYIILSTPLQMMSLN